MAVRTLTTAEIQAALARSRPPAYPEPTIRLAPSGENLLVTFPGRLGWTVTIPLTIDGLLLLKRTLEERKRCEDRRIGTTAAPTQHLVQAWLKEHGAKVRLPKDLEELGDLEIEI